MQQLMSRGIYTDVITPALEANIENCFGIAGDRTKCEAPNASSILELYPFFDVQLTKLARWSETKPNDPVDVSNEELDDRNPYSRGLAALAGSKLGMSQTHSIIEDGNVGLISTLPVAAVPTPAYSTADLYVRAGDVTTPPPPSGVEVTGSLSNQGGTSDAAIAVIVGDGANCGKPTNSTFLCVIEPGASLPTITISNYVKAHTALIACSDELTMTAFTVGVTAASNSTTFLLPVEPTSGITITISKHPC
jgi:hypothetical protein